MNCIYSKIHGKVAFSRKAHKLLDWEKTECHSILLTNCETMWKEVCKLSALDALCMVEYYRACGEFSRSNALLRISRSLYPEDLKLAVSWSYFLSITQSPLVSVRYLESLQPNTQAEENLINENKLYYFSEIGFVSDIGELCKSVNNATILSQVKYSLFQWSEAKYLTQEALKSTPENLHLRRQLIHVLLALGEEEEAKNQAVTLIGSGSCYIAEVDYFLIFVFYVLGDVLRSIELARAYLERWSKAKNTTSVKCWLIRFLALENQNSAIHEVLASLSPDPQKEMSPLLQSLDRRFLKLPMICQGKDMCVPTALGMICHLNGIEIQTDTLYREMGGVEGTEMWRAQEVMAQKGFVITYVDIDLETIKRLIREGTPILAQTTGLFSSHVEIISGYDDAEQCIYIRDPQKWYPVLVDYDAILQRYASAGSYGICYTLSPMNVQYNKNTIGSDLMAAFKCCETGSSEDLCSLLVPLQDICGLEYEIIRMSYGATLDPAQCEEKLAHIIESKNTPEHVICQALLQTSNQNILSRWLSDQEKRDKTKHSFFSEYVSVIHDYLCSEWRKCQYKLTKLIRRYPYQGSLWLLLAEIEFEVGNIEEAMYSAKRALNLNPNSIWTLSRTSGLFPHLLTHEELSRKLEDYEVKRPGSIAAIEFAALLNLDKENGKKFEDIALTCVERRPKLPENYTRIARWYLNQEREDLAKDILDRGRVFVGIEQLPYWSFEDESKEDCSVESKLNEVAQQTEPKQRIGKILEDKSLGVYSAIDQLRDVFFDGYEAGQNDKEAEYSVLLPEALPGVFPHNLNYYLEGFNFPYFNSIAQSTLLDWSKRLIGSQVCAPELEFSIAYLIELLGDYTQAERKYREIISRYIGHSGSYYRLGRLEQLRGNLNEAIVKHEEAVRRRPSLIGSVDELITLNTSLSNIEEIIRWYRYRADFHPYDMNYLGLLLEQLVEHRPLEDVLGELENRRAFCTAEHYLLLNSRVLAEGKAYTRALEAIKSIDTKSRHRWVTELIAYKGLDETREAINVCSQALKECANDQWFTANQIELLQKSGDMEGALNSVEQQIRSGDSSRHYIDSYLKIKSPSLDDIQMFLSSTSKEHRIEIVEALSSCAADSYEINEWKSLLIFIDKHFPEAFQARVSLAYRYMMAHEHKLAIQTMDDIYERSGKSGEWLFSLAKVYEDTRRKDALRMYKQYYDRTGDVDALIDIGRCYHIDGDENQAKRYYQRALSLNPFADLAVNNLVQMGGSIKQYSGDFHRMIGAGYGASTQYFCVNAVRCAKKAGKKVSSNWINVAIERLKLMEIEKPFRDEPTRMYYALHQWHLKHGDAELANKYKSKLGLKGLWISLTDRSNGDWVPV